MRRGSLLSIFFLMTLLLSLYIVVTLGSFTLGEISSGFDNANYSQIAKNITKAENTINTTMDGAFVLITIMAGIAIMAGAIVIMQSPIAFVVGLFVMVLGVFFAMLTSNMAEIWSAQAVFGTLFTNYFITTQMVFENLPVFMVTLFGLIMILFVAKRKGVVDV